MEPRDYSPYQHSSSHHLPYSMLWRLWGYMAGQGSFQWRLSVCCPCSPIRSSHNHHSDYSAAIMHFLCSNAIGCNRPSHIKLVEMGTQMRIPIVVCAVHMEARQALHHDWVCTINSWPGRTEKWSFTLSRGSNPGQWIHSLAHQPTCHELPSTSTIVLLSHAVYTKITAQVKIPPPPFDTRGHNDLWHENTKKMRNSSRIV